MIWCQPKKHSCIRWKVKAHSIYYYLLYITVFIHIRISDLSELICVFHIDVKLRFDLYISFSLGTLHHGRRIIDTRRWFKVDTNRFGMIWTSLIWRFPNFRFSHHPGIQQIEPYPITSIACSQIPGKCPLVVQRRNLWHRKSASVQSISSSCFRFVYILWMDCASWTLFWGFLQYIVLIFCQALLILGGTAWWHVDSEWTKKIWQFVVNTVCVLLCVYDYVFIIYIYIYSGWVVLVKCLKKVATPLATCS